MKKEHKATAKKILLIVLSVLLVLAIALAVVLTYAFRNVAGKETDGKQSMEDVAKDLVMSVIDETADSIKTELELTIEDLLNENTAGARARANKISEEIGNLRKPLAQAVSLLKKASPSKAKKLEAAGVLLDAAEVGLEEIMHPAIDLMEEYPISQLKVGDGFNTVLIGQYLDFLEVMLPKSTRFWQASIPWISASWATISENTCPIWIRPMKSWQFSGMTRL